MVEGASERVVVESRIFRQWLQQNGMSLVDPVVVAGGHGQMGRTTSGGIGLASLLRKQVSNLDRVVVLADLDPSRTVACISERKDLIDSQAADLVVVARKALESWFLADTDAMRSWTKDDSYYEECPEATPEMPWDRLKEVGYARRGRSKVSLARLLVNQHEFDIVRAAEHPQCPTARYFVKRVSALASR